MTTCMTCQLLHARDAGDRPLWDNIHRTAHWDVVHSYNTSLAGWLVLIARRHSASIAELNEAESMELGWLLRLVSIAVQQATGCEKTYVVQFAEHPQHPHVHFHVIPRMTGLPADERGPSIFKHLGVSDTERVSEVRMNEIAAHVRAFLTDAHINASTTQ